MSQSLYDFCVENRRTELLEEWDRAKNADLSPKDISYGSRKRVWWRCAKGHAWQAMVYTRSTASAVCPVCSNKRVVAGENDLLSLRPDIAAQWHPYKNGDLTPANVTVGSHRTVWWQCDRGHEWQSRVHTRTDGSGCPICANRRLRPGANDLAALYPDIAAQWDAEKNGALTPEMVMPNSSRRVWWRCALGHSYQTGVSLRTSKQTECPFCAGSRVLEHFNDLGTLEPEIAAQWHPTLNGSLTPEMVTVGSRKKVWWQCADGHVWKTAVYTRTGDRKRGCPVCAGTVKRRRYGQDRQIPASKL